LISDKVIVLIQKNLYGLKDFLDKNPHLFHSSTAESAARAPTLEQEAWKVRHGHPHVSLSNSQSLQAEQTSVAELLSLLNRTIEALSFVLLLNDYRLAELIPR
jgi:nuclear pore complex protein Nup155